jgi:hypothetical protein
MQKMPGWLSAVMTDGIFMGLVLLKLQRPLRKGKSEPKLRRNVRNMAVAGTSALAVMLTGAPVTTPLTKWLQARNWGLLKWLQLPLWLEVSIALIELARLCIHQTSSGFHGQSREDLIVTQSVS